MWWMYFMLFFIILFSYVHIQNQFKAGEDLEIYEYDVTSVTALQEMLHLKQPVTFYLDLAQPPIEPLEFLEVKDRRDYQRNNTTKNIESIQLSFETARTLIETDTKGLFYSNRNRPNLPWKKWFEKMDTFLKPTFSIYTETDLIYGSKHARTTTSFHRESHVFLYIPPETNTSSIRLRMTPPKSKLFLNPVNDYTYFENWSPVDLFEQHDKIQCIDFVLKPGYVLFIPPFWFYSIEFQENKNEICMIKYTTCANFIAKINHVALFYMQQQNIQEKWLKPLQHAVFKLEEPNEPDPKPEIVVDLSQCSVHEESKVVKDDKLIQEVCSSII